MEFWWTKEADKTCLLLDNDSEFVGVFFVTVYLINDFHSFRSSAQKQNIISFANSSKNVLNALIVWLRFEYQAPLFLIIPHIVDIFYRLSTWILMEKICTNKTCKLLNRLQFPWNEKQIAKLPTSFILLPLTRITRMENVRIFHSSSNICIKY